MGLPQQSGLTSTTAIVPGVTNRLPCQPEHAAEVSRHRLYSLAFWMTDNELMAEQIAATVFHQVSVAGLADDSILNRAFLSEIRSLMPIGTLSLRCAVATEELNVRRNTRRVHLERAVVQLPPTERFIFVMHDVDGYHRSTVAELLGISTSDCILGLHQARLRIRELVADMGG